MSLPERLENAAEALPEDADRIRPANGDPHQLLVNLDGPAAGRVLDWMMNHAPTEAGELAMAWLEAPLGLEVIADYVAGMTDRFAVAEHQKLFGSNQDPILSI